LLVEARPDQLKKERGRRSDQRGLELDRAKGELYSLISNEDPPPDGQQSNMSSTFRDILLVVKQMGEGKRSADTSRGGSKEGRGEKGTNPSS